MAGTFAISAKQEERACTLDREMAEMEEIMGPRIPDKAEFRRWLEDYRKLRRSMIVRGDNSMWRVTRENEKVVVDLDPRVITRKWPAELPGEMKL